MRFQPVLVEFDQPVTLPDFTKRVTVALARCAPVLEDYAELEGCLGCAHELTLIDAEKLVKSVYGGNGRLTHTHGSDLVGFDQGDFEQVTQPLGQAVSCQPTSRSTTGDDYANFRLHQWFFILAVSQADNCKSSNAGIRDLKVRRMSV